MPVFAWIELRKQRNVRQQWFNQSKKLESAQKPTSVEFNLPRLAGEPVSWPGNCEVRPGYIYDWKTMVEMICGKSVFWDWSEREGVIDGWRWWKRWSGMTKEVRQWGRDWEMWIRLTEWFRKLVPEVDTEYRKERLVIFKKEDIEGLQVVTTDEPLTEGTPSNLSFKLTTLTGKKLSCFAVKTAWSYMQLFCHSTLASQTTDDILWQYLQLRHSAKKEMNNAA